MSIFSKYIIVKNYKIIVDKRVNIWLNDIVNKIQSHYA